jgi:hypothetical protein
MLHSWYFSRSSPPCLLLQNWGHVWGLGFRCEKTLKVSYFSILLSDMSIKWQWMTLWIDSTQFIILVIPIDTIHCTALINNFNSNLRFYFGVYGKLFYPVVLQIAVFTVSNIIWSESEHFACALSPTNCNRQLVGSSQKCTSPLGLGGVRSWCVSLWSKYVSRNVYIYVGFSYAGIFR